MKGLWALPPSWTWAEFGEVARVDSQLVDPAGYAQRPHIAPNHIESGTGRLLEYTTVADDGVTSGKHLFRAGHILYSKIRPYLAKVVVVDFAGLCSADMYPVSTSLETGFLHQWLVSPMFTQQAAHNQGRTVLPKINQDALALLPVPVAPTNEQRRIVAKLEALRVRSRRAREALDTVPPLLEKLRQSILAAAFRGDLTKDWRAKHTDVEPASELLKRIRVERRKKWEQTELAKMKSKGKTPVDDKWRAKYQEPEPLDSTGLPKLPGRWCWASVEELTGLVTSGSRGWAEYYADAGPLFIRSQDINADTLRLGEVAHVEVPASAEGARTRVQPFDLLITITGANVTRCAWVTEDPGEAYVSQHVALVRPVLGSAAPFLHFWFVAETGARKQLKKAAYGLGKPGLNLDDVSTVRVPLAPAAEQVELVTRANQLFGVATGAELSLKALFLRLEHLERSTLAKAFRGELLPQDPNDEPAEAMLARVRGANGPVSNGAQGKRGSGPRTSREGMP